jgi:hypothetical protein
MAAAPKIIYQNSLRRFFVADKLHAEEVQILLVDEIYLH